MPPAPSNHRLDTSGTLCPIPVLLTERRVRQLPPGSRLEVVGDDPALSLDLRAWCARTGHRLLELEAEVGGVVRAVVEVRP